MSLCGQWSFNALTTIHLMVFFCTGSSSALQHPSSYQKTSCTGSQLSAHMIPDGDADGMWLYQLHAKLMTYTDHL